MHTIAFDSIQINTPHFEACKERFERLIGGRPLYQSKDKCGFDLGNTVLSLHRDSGASRTHIAALTLASPGASHLQHPINNPLGLVLFASTGSENQRLRENHDLPGNGVHIDHLVLKTTDAELCIKTFQNQLGIRLALDQDKPEWGGRMLFFRAGKMTLEAIENATFKKHEFWGIALACDDLASHRKRLHDNGVYTSEIRDGRKPGTIVSTVKDDILALPVLLIEHLSNHDIGGKT